MTESEEYKLFQGCVIGNRIPFIEASARKVFEKLGIKTSDPEDFYYEVINVDV